MDLSSCFMLRALISCSFQPSQNNIKVVINGAAKEIGKATIVAVTKARGMEVAGALDSVLGGQDARKSGVGRRRTFFSI